jgi:TusA-related sulfurtransferase
MTYVRVRLALDRMSSGQTLLVLLAGKDPERNVPVSAEAQGHTVLSNWTGADGITQVLLQKA